MSFQRDTMYADEESRPVLNGAKNRKTKMLAVVGGVGAVVLLTGMVAVNSARSAAPQTVSASQNYYQTEYVNGDPATAHRSRLDFPVEQAVQSPVPWENADIMSNLPSEIDWRNHNGRSYVTVNLNQHIPEYCGSCWAHAAASVIGDRIKIMRKGAWPEYSLSIQYMLNCGEHQAGSCEGGSSEMVFKMAMTMPIPEKTCLQYTARDDYCTDFNTCRNCEPPTGAGRCFARSNFTSFSVSEYGKVKGVKNIMAEIATRGPVVAGIDANGLTGYTGGIVTSQQGEGKKFIDHMVAIGGYGTDPATGIDYWIVRNSWGDYWGENGWFRIQRGVNAHAIETEVAWAIPTVVWDDAKIAATTGKSN